VPGDPQPAGGRAEREVLARGIDREAVAVDEIVGVLLGQAFSQHLVGGEDYARHSLSEIPARRLPCAMHSVRSSSLTGWSSARPAKWLAPYGVPPARVALSSACV